MENRVVSYPQWTELLNGVQLDYERVVVPALVPVAPPRPAEDRKIHFEPTPYELIAQCPKCKTVETLQFVEHTLTPSRKFFQKDNKVYHDCGSELPCHLHR